MTKRGWSVGAWLVEAKELENWQGDAAVFDDVAATRSSRPGGVFRCGQTRANGGCATRPRARPDRDVRKR